MVFQIRLLFSHYSATWLSSVLELSRSVPKIRGRVGCVAPLNTLNNEGLQMAKYTDEIGDRLIEHVKDLIPGLLLALPAFGIIVSIIFQSFAKLLPSQDFAVVFRSFITSYFVLPIFLFTVYKFLPLSRIKNLGKSGTTLLFLSVAAGLFVTFLLLGGLDSSGALMGWVLGLLATLGIMVFLNQVWAHDYIRDSAKGQWAISLFCIMSWIFAGTFSLMNPYVALKSYSIIPAIFQSVIPLVLYLSYRFRSKLNNARHILLITVLCLNSIASLFFWHPTLRSFPPFTLLKQPTEMSESFALVDSLNTSAAYEKRFSEITDTLPKLETYYKILDSLYYDFTSGKRRVYAEHKIDSILNKLGDSSVLAALHSEPPIPEIAAVRSIRTTSYSNWKKNYVSAGYDSVAARTDSGITTLLRVADVDAEELFSRSLARSRAGFKPVLILAKVQGIIFLLILIVLLLYYRLLGPEPSGLFRRSSVRQSAVDSTNQLENNVQSGSRVIDSFLALLVIFLIPLSTPIDMEKMEFGTPFSVMSLPNWHFGSFVSDLVQRPSHDESAASAGMHDKDRSPELTQEWKQLASSIDALTEQVKRLDVSTSGKDSTKGSKVVQAINQLTIALVGELERKNGSNKGAIGHIIDTVIQQIAKIPPAPPIDKDFLLRDLPTKSDLHNEVSSMVPKAVIQTMNRLEFEVLSDSIRRLRNLVKGAQDTKSSQVNFYEQNLTNTFYSMYELLSKDQSLSVASEDLQPIGDWKPPH